MTFANLIDRLGLAMSFAVGLAVMLWGLCGLEAAGMG